MRAGTMPKRLVAIALLATAALGSPPAGAAPHPSLLFDASELPVIRERLAGPLAPIGEAIAAGVEYPYQGGNFPKSAELGYQYFGDRRALADTLGAFAFAALAFEGQSPVGEHAAELAKSYLSGVCALTNWVFPETQDSAMPDLNLAHFLINVSFAYDFLYDRIDESLRASCRKRVAIEGQKMFEASPVAWWRDEYLQNHHWINNASLGITALAFEGELGADTGAWLARALEEIEKVRTVLELIEGGAWHEGPGYLGYGFDALIPFGMAYSRRTGKPDLADVQILRDFPKLRMLAMPPSLDHRREVPIWGDYSGSRNDGTFTLAWWLARNHQDRGAAWYAAQFAEGKTQGKGGFTSWPPSQRSLMLAALLYDESVTPEAPPGRGSAWALDYFAKDLSLAISRSGWQDEGTLIAFKSGVYGGHANFERLKNGGAPGGQLDWGHDHADDMTLFVFGHGEWLTTTVPAYYIGRDNGQIQGNRTKFANSLLVDGVGQLGEGIRTCGMHSCPWFWERTSEIALRGSTANHAYWLGAGSQLYPKSLGLKTFGRSLLFVDREILLVRDVVEADSVRRFDVVFHAIDDVIQEPGWLKLNAKNDRSLGVRVLAPSQYAVDTESQTTVHLDKFDPDAKMTAAYIRPASDVAAVTFLNALVPVGAGGWATRAKPEPLDAGQPDRGASIEIGPVRHELVFNSAPASSISLKGIELTGMAGGSKQIDGSIEHVLLAAGSTLAIGGVPWIEVIAGAPATLEVAPTSNGVAVSGEVEEALIYAPAAESVTFNGKPIDFVQEGDRVRLFVAKSSGAGTGGTAGSSSGGSGGSLAGAGSGQARGDALPADGGCTCRASGGGAGSGAPFALALALLAAARTVSRRRWTPGPRALDRR
jgi:hypothetical protein